MKKKKQIIGLQITKYEDYPQEKTNISKIKYNKN